MIETTIHMYIRMWCKMTLSFRFSLHTYCCCIASQIGRCLLDAEFLSPRGGGKYVSVCKTCGKLGGSEGMLPWEILIFGPFIRRNLVEFGTVFAQNGISVFDNP